MLSYNQFKNLVLESFKNYLPEKYQNCELEQTENKKVNCILEGFCVKIPDSNVAPTIYFDDLYMNYMECKDIHKVLRSAANTIEESLENLPMIDVKDFYKNTDDIILQLMNTKQNEKILSQIPHREFQDLSIVYKKLIDNETIGKGTALITNELMSCMNLNEEELFQLASQNTPQLMPFKIYSSNELIKNLLTQEGFSQEEIEEYTQDIPCDMWVLTNTEKFYGSSVLLYPDELQKVASKVNDNLYIIPSSIHDIIAVSASLNEPDNLAEIVAMVNGTEVNLEERLSNQVYYFDRESKSLSLATDVENTRLDDYEEERE